MISLLLIFIGALIFPGLISITKAKLSGKKGPGIFQPYKDILRLLKKGSVYSSTTSFVFQVAPIIYMASVLGAILMIPFGNFKQGLISFEGDFLMFAYMLAFGKFLMIISALDTGSGFEGMGANREALYSMLVEPAFFIVLSSVVMLSGYTSFYEMFTHFHVENYVSWLYVAISVYLLIQITLIENSRLPVDDPKTHLELTMVHEVMVLDNSGFDLGLIQITGALKFAMFGALIGNLVIPPMHLGFELSALAFVVIQALFAITVGFMESFRARLKMIYNPQFILTLSGIALIAFFAVFFITKTI
ncbi:MAG: NADH-quinone oxidoreductase subunit H [Cyclobacteriaceae bacterium]|nr:NADH-quinone oxidoreductase subunit H [Cyclobacteriaceae bacterium]